MVNDHNAMQKYGRKKRICIRSAVSTGLQAVTLFDSGILDKLMTTQYYADTLKRLT